MGRVLLAEDDSTMRDMARRALESDGHTVVEAHDGQEALDLLATEVAGFDVMLTDVQMPSVDGITLSLKAVEKFPNLRIILMTAFAGSAITPDRLKSNVKRVLQKPLALNQLRGAVRAVLSA